jgi:hypothetical protein
MLMTKKLIGSISALLSLLPLLPSLGADPVEFPQYREGLWEAHMQTIDKSTNKKDESSFKVCRSNATEKAAYEHMKTMKECKFDIQNLGGGKYASTSSCTVGGSVIESKSTFEISATSSHSETHTTYTPPLYGKSEEVSTQEQKFIGSCPAGTKPGQIIPAGGT